MLILCWASVVDNWHTSIQHCQSYSVNRKVLHQPNVFLMLALRRKQWTNVKPISGQCVVLTETAPVRTMTQRWVHVNPQSEMLSQHKTKSGSYHNFRHSAGIFVLHKSKSTTTQVIDAYSMLLLCWRSLYRMDQLLYKTGWSHVLVIIILGIQWKPLPSIGDKYLYKLVSQRCKESTNLT